MSKRTRSPSAATTSSTNILVPEINHLGAHCVESEAEEEGLIRKSSRVEDLCIMSSAAPQESQQNVETDQAFLDRYSRQIGTYGLDTMTKLISLKVLIVGCGSVGAEAAKNLSLAGIHSITLIDTRVPTAADLNVNFAVSEDDVNNTSTTIAEVTQKLLRDLNPTVRCRVETAVTEELVLQHGVVVWTAAAPDVSLKTLVRWNEFCRTRTPVAISFLFAFQGGPLGSVFVDHGPLFTVRDVDGRSLLQKQILEVHEKVDKKGRAYTRVRFSTPEGMTPGALRDYTQVKFTDVKGLVLPNGESINEHMFDAVCCTSDAKNCLRIYPSLASRGYSPYVTGGFIHEQKEVKEVAFRSLQDALTAPGAFTIVSPFMDGALEGLVHATAVGLLRFADHHEGRLPALHDAAAADEVLLHTKEYLNENAQATTGVSIAAQESAEVGALTEDPNDEFPAKYPPPPPPKPFTLDSLDEAFVRTVAKLAVAELQPLGAFFGAVVAQEIVKVTGKYMPIHQFFNFHCAEVLPEGADYSSPEFTPRGCRYDHNIAIFGAAFQEKLLNLKLFMVGCGALGCENIKNFALAGICCGPSGTLIVTDNDRIEISNLSRQFLFREDNVGQPKSVAACNRMLKMNKDAKVDARQDFVGPTTQYLYPDSFWFGLDAVVNALDNIEARLYVDRQCVLFHKILVEAGTMGTAGNIDIIVPGKTTSYADGGAADETGGIPMCTLRNFPYIYDHCIEWSRAQFDDHFVSPVQESMHLIEDPTGFVTKLKAECARALSANERRALIEKHLKALRGVSSTLSVVKSRPTLHDCVEMAWRALHSLFRDKILDLQIAFPKDATKSNGEPFWSGHRTYPTAIDGSAESMEAHPDVLDFLISATNLFATMFGIHPPKHAPRLNDPKNRWMQQYRKKEWILEELKTIPIPEFKHASVEGLDEESTSALKESESKSSHESVEAQFEEALLAVEALGHACKESKAEPVDFEKDDDDNFHIDFITAAANLRASNYAIKPQDRLKVKMVAGKIIPAIATTTAAVTGLALIEFYKVLQGKDVSALRNGMIDVGTNNYVLFERDPPLRKRTTVEKTYIPEKDYTYRKKIIRVPNGFTKYDTFTVDVNATMTVREFSETLLAQLNATLPEGSANEFDILAIGVGKGTLWNGSMKHSNTNRPLLAVIEEQKRREGFPEERDFWATRELFPDLEVNFTIDDEDDVDDVEVDAATIVLRVKK